MWCENIFSYILVFSLHLEYVYFLFSASAFIIFSFLFWYMKPKIFTFCHLEIMHNIIFHRILENLLEKKSAKSVQSRLVARESKIENECLF